MNQNVQVNSIIPLYRQISSILMERIANEELKPGEKIPSETVLTKKFGVSRVTIRAAIAELVEDGVLERLQGKGTFVSEPKKLYNANDKFGFSRSCLIAGKTPRTELLNMDFVLPPQKIQEFLNLKDGKPALHTQRLRYVDDTPTLIENNYYSLTLSFLMQENLNDSLFNILQKHDLSVVTQSRSLEICHANKKEADLLKIKKGSPLLLFIDQQLDAQGNPLFFSKQLYCTERLKFYL